MASAVASCAPCVFAAASTTLLSFPYEIIGTLHVSVQTQFSVINGSTSTYFVTTTVEEPAVSSVPPVPGSPPVVNITAPGDFTWTTLGTTLTYPETYVEYLAFEGAAATTSGCAESLSPTALSLPAGVDLASLIFPINDTATLPAALLGYLDGAGLPAQLAGDQLTTCALPGPVTAAPSSMSSLPASTSNSTSVSVVRSTTVISLSTSTTTVIESTSEVSLSVSPVSGSAFSSTSSSAPSTRSVNAPSSTSTSISYSTTVIATSVVIATTATVTHTPARVISTVSVPDIIISGSSTSTLSSTPTALPISLPSSAVLSASASSAGSAAAGIFNSEVLSVLLSELASKPSVTSSSTRDSIKTSASTTSAPYIYPNTTISTGKSSYLVGPVTAAGSTYAVINATSTTYTVPYTGAAQKALRLPKVAWVECLFGLALPALL